MSEYKITEREIEAIEFLKRRGFELYEVITTSELKIKSLSDEALARGAYGEARYQSEGANFLKEIGIYLQDETIDIEDVERNVLNE